MNKLFFALAAVFSILVFSAPAFAQVSDGLIGHWKFDGNGNNEIAGGAAAVAVGSAEFKSSGGQSGGYLYVNTSSDWGKIPYSSTFDLANSFTVEFWFRQRSDQSFLQDLVYKGSLTNNYNFRVFRQLWNQYNFGPVMAGSTAVNTGYWSQVSNGNQLAHGSWHHVAYTRNSTGAAYYLDGVLWNFLNLTQYSEYSGSVKTPAVDIIIGDSAVDTDFDNLRIYNRALSYNEVTSNGGFPAPTTTSTTTTYATTTTASGWCRKEHGNTSYVEQQYLTYYNGTCFSGNGTFADYCDGTGISEYVCASDNACLKTTALCPNGCANGACLGTVPTTALLQNATATTASSPASPTSPASPASPSPNAQPTNATTTTFHITTTTSAPLTTSNTCSVPNGAGVYSNGLCIINYCNSGYYNCDGNSVNGCESMSPCSTSAANGTPAGKKQTCSDSDGGISTYARGFTTDKNGDVSEDKCSENNLAEFYCKDGEVSSHETSCANGCNDGTCVSPFAKLIQDLIALIKSIFGLK